MEYVVESQNFINIMSGFISAVAGTELGYVLLGFIAAGAVYALRYLILYAASGSHYFDHAVYLVRLPKEKPGDKEKEFTVQQMHEEIAVAEMFFSSIGGLRAQRSIRSWLFGRNDHFSFEIVAHDKLISYYVVAPRHMSRYLEQQIEAYYPDAVMEEVEDYNIFKPFCRITAGTMRTTRHFILPLRTYKKMDADPVNSILNVISKLEENEGIAIQFVARSANGAWHRQAVEVVRKAYKNYSVKDAMKYVNTGLAGKLFYFLADMFMTRRLNDKKNMNSQYDSMNNYNKRFSAMEEEMLKGIEEKNSKAGLDVNFRIVISTSNSGKNAAYLQNISNAFQQYNYYQFGNTFMSHIQTGAQNRTINDFIYRRFDERRKFLLNTEELCSLYHFPLHTAETPNILWLTARHAPAPTDIPTGGIILGQNYYRGTMKEIKIRRDDRRRHTYIIGKSGVGKSQLMAGMAIQDILNGEGVCVLDPHGDLIADIIDRIPPQRAEDVILFSPADIERPLALNLMEFDPRYPEQKSFVINEIIKIFDKLYDLKATGGPIFEQYMRNAMLLVMSDPESGSTLMEIPKVLADSDFRRLKLERCSDPTVVDFWKKEAEKAGGEAALANIVPYITSKLTSFISNDMMRPIIGQQNSSFNLRDVMDNRKILLVNLSKGQIGELNAYLLGMILVGKILMSALSRADIAGGARKDFYLYIDEFQNFTTDSICSILSEARKYNLNLIIAHQYLGQLTVKQDASIKDAVFGNVGTWLVFKIGSEDAEVMQKEFSPVFNSYDLINIEKYTAYVKLLIDNTASRPFSMTTLWPIPGIPNEAVAAKIKALSRYKYGQDRSIIEAEIRQRARMQGG